MPIPISGGQPRGVEFALLPREERPSVGQERREATETFSVAMMTTATATARRLSACMSSTSDARAKQVS